MKTNFRSAKLTALLAILCSALAITSAFAQFGPFFQTNFWIGIPGTVDGTNFGISTNWSNGTTNFNPPISGTLCQFAGAVGGVVNVVSYDGIDHNSGALPIGGSFGASGVSIELTSNQTNPVNFFCPISVAQSAGMGFNDFRVDSGAGQFTIGNDTASQLTLTLRPSAGIHVWENDSTNPVVLMPSMQIQNGGGNQHEIDFMGTGDFAITNNLRNNNNAPVNNIQFFNTGTTTWVAGGPNNVFHDGGLANVTINPGSTLIIKTNGLLPITFGNILTHNGNLLKFDAVSTASDTLNRQINGNGNIQWNGGTWTLTSGASTYSGSNLLTGGELIANGSENPGVSGPLGVGSTISFQGGTLGFGPNDAADYSSRFDTSPNQAYSIDTAGLSVTFATGLSSSGGTLTKLGAGTLTLSGTSTYTGSTTVSAGELVFQGAKAGGSITVVDGAALGVTAGSSVTPDSLTLGSSAGCTLEFNNVISISTAPLTAGSLSSAGIITINVSSFGFIPGQNYPLLSWTTGTAPAVRAGDFTGVIGTLATNGNSIVLHAVSTPYLWSGSNNNSWDLTTPNNWIQNGGPVTYTNGGLTVFDDSSTRTNVVINDLVNPSLLTFANVTNAYTLTNSAGKNIAFNARVLISGGGTVMMIGGANTYNGVTTVGKGTLSVSGLANGFSPSDIGAANNSASNLVLDGGVFQYTGGPVSIDRLFTLTTNGGTIDSSGFGPLTLNNNGSFSYIGFSVRTLTLTGTEPDNNTLAAVLADNGTPTSLTKNGPGKWVLTGNNTYSGVTTIANGELQVGNGGATGTLGSGAVVNNGSLDFNRTGTLTNSSAINGTGSVTNDGAGTVILANNNSYSGGTYINAGTLQVGNGGGTGSLNPTGAIINNGLLIFNTTGTYAYTGSGLISGPGNVKVTGSGLIKAIGANSYTGWTLIDTNATFQPCEGNQGQLLSSVVTNYGTLKFVRQDQGVFGYSNNIVGSGRVLMDVDCANLNDVTLMGVNTYTGGTVIAGGGIVLGDNATPGAGSIVGNVIFTNSPSSGDIFRYLTFNRPDSFTFSGTIGGKGGASPFLAGMVVQNGSGTLTLTATNTYLGGTTVSNGTIVYTGTINSTGGGIVNGTLTFSNSATSSLSGGFSGTGAIVMGGSGLTTLGASNNANFTGSMTASNGILVVSRSAGGTVNVSGGTLAAGGFKTINTLAIGDSAVSPAVAGSLNINSGTVSMSLNKALAQSNSFVQMTVTNVLTTFTINGDNSITTNTTVTSATGTITYTGGTLQLINVGPTLQVGDRFVLFSEPIPGGNSIPITASGFTATSSLGTDGSVVITSVALPPAPKISKISQSGTNLIITATNNSGPGGSWDLLATNILGGPLANWPIINSGTFDANGNLTLTNPIGTNAQQFFDLRVP
jgi:fibronectin-binding autotransporter adhesin